MTAAPDKRSLDTFSSSEWLSREQPFLYPYNRRLRHLKGVSLRNLAFAASTTRRRGATIDDESLPQTWKSPEKLLALRDRNPLAHSQSSTDLNALHANGSAVQANTVGRPHGKDETPTKRPNTKMRRRSTAHWIGASPAVRQKKLEDIASERLADVFFSIEVHDYDEPIYVSEVLIRVMNPSFNFFNLEDRGPLVTRREQLILKIWTRPESAEQFALFIEYEIDLMSLQYLGKELASLSRPLPQNCVLFHLSDGIYTSYTDVPGGVPKFILSDRPSRKTTQSVTTTSSFESLMKLATLDDCIQDALGTSGQIATQIDALIAKHRPERSVIEQAAQKSEELRNLRQALQLETKKLKRQRERKSESISSLQARRQALRQGITSQSGAQPMISDADTASHELQKEVEVSTEEIQGQRRRISEELMRIFPIEPVVGQPLSFTIRGFHLPNTSFEDADEENVAAAFGYVAHLIYLLSCYLSHPLPYPLTLCSSTSTIEDPIAVMAGSRIYPLFPKGSISFRFEYGVFLLDKNIEVLLNRVGLRALDIRHTLPNIKYLLYVLAAGKGEIPARKAGGIKGLLSAGRSPALSRINSQDSDLGTWTKRIAGSSLRHVTRHKAEPEIPSK